MITNRLEMRIYPRHVDEVYVRMLDTLFNSGVLGVALDIDDTLLDTESVFRQLIDQTITNIAAQSGIDERVARATFMAANTEAFTTHHVRPDRWLEVLKQTGKVLANNSRAFLEEYLTLNKIYTTPIPWHDGARELLWALREVGDLPIALVTNANNGWTRWKVETSGLDLYADHIVVVDERRKKDKRDWIWAAELMGIEPLSMLGIGDSVPSDIKPLQEIGSMVVALPSPVHVYRGSIGRVIQVEKIGQVASALAAYEPA